MGNRGKQVNEWPGMELDDRAAEGPECCITAFVGRLKVMFGGTRYRFDAWKLVVLCLKLARHELELRFRSWGEKKERH